MGVDVSQMRNEVLLPRKGTKEANAHNHCFEFFGLVSVVSFICSHAVKPVIYFFFFKLLQKTAQMAISNNVNTAKLSEANS